MEMAVEGAE